MQEVQVEMVEMGEMELGQMEKSFKVAKEAKVEMELNLLAQKAEKEDLGGLVGSEEVLQDTPIEDIILQG